MSHTWFVEVDAVCLQKWLTFQTLHIIAFPLDVIYIFFYIKNLLKETFSKEYINLDGMQGDFILW